MTSIESVPAFIISRDQLTWLSSTVDWIKSLNHISEIIILDNNSSYPPLLDWYSTTDCTVEMFSDNLGKYTLWGKDMVPDKHFVLTDPDLEPCEDVRDIIDRFHSLLHKYNLNKVGSALKIDDVKDREVVEWEQKWFWGLELERNVYNVNLDTTFALYKPNAPYTLNEAARVAGKYTLKHLPWYEDKPDDYYYYRDNIDTRFTHWTLKDLESNNE